MKKIYLIVFCLILLLSIILIYGYDPNAPSIDINIKSPGDGLNATNSTIYFKFNATGNFSSYFCSVYTNISGTFAVTSDVTVVLNNTQTRIPLTLGQESYIWDIFCENGSGGGSPVSNFSTSNRTIFIDSIPPVITIHSPADNAYIQTVQPMWFNFSVVEKHTGGNNGPGNTSNCLLYVNGTLVRNMNYSGSVYHNESINTTVGSGTSTWKLSCNDTYGLITNTTARTMYLGRGPAITVNYPADNTLFDSSAITLNVSVSGFAVDYSCSAYSNDTGTWAQEKTFTATNDVAVDVPVVLSEGDIITGIRCYDSGTVPTATYVYNWSGNTSHLVDLTDPVVAINFPTNNSYVDGDTTFQLNISVTDPHFVNCSLWVNGTVWNSTVGPAVHSAHDVNTFNWTVTTPYSFTAGVINYYFNLMCNDTVNRTTNSSTLWFTMDSVYPTMVYNDTNRTISNSCTDFGIFYSFSEEVNTTVSYGLDGTEDFSTPNATDTSFLINRTVNISFADNWEDAFYVNVTFVDRAGNKRNNSYSYRTPAPVPLCTGWSLYSIYDRNITLQGIYNQSTANYVYAWNSTVQSWVYYTSAATTNLDYQLGVGDVVFLYESGNTTWFRNNSRGYFGVGAGAVSLEKNITEGHNWIGLYNQFQFFNITNMLFRNKSGGNITHYINGTGNGTVFGLEFQVDYFNAFNNTVKEYASHIYTWAWNNLTLIGTNTTLDTLHVYSDYNLTLNITYPGSGFVTMNWTV